MKLKLIACEIFCREICAVVASSPHVCDLEFLPKGLHDLGADKMLGRIQGLIDAMPADEYDAAILAYGLCNNGIVGLHSESTRLVIPRSHDCIGLLMGDRSKYRKYFDAHPGTYYRSTGWYEREDSSGADDETIPQKLGLFMKYDELVEQYGEDNAQYVMETMGDSAPHYDRLTYIQVGLDCEGPFVERAEAEAGEKGWVFDRFEGSMELLRKLCHGEWDEQDFLLIEPGQTIAPSHDESIIKCTT